MRLPASTVFVSAVLALFPAKALTAQGQPQPPRCDTAAHRQFDFWVGDWVVMAGTDTAGTNLVTLVEDGCIIHEHWIGSKGGTGQSFNFFNRVDQQWHQLWVDNSGNVLNLAGTYTDPELRYTGETVRRNGTRILQELTFTRNPDGTVRQYWRSSTDGGATWAVSFDGLYRKKR
jgi:hypothetical protein